MHLDLGDITLHVTATVKGFRPPTFTWRIGRVSDTTRADRTTGPRPEYKTRPGKVDLIMDLKADQKVDFTLAPTDEMGNPTTFDGTIAFAVDDPSIVNLADNGDGSGTAAATGALGATLLTATATRSDGVVATGTAVINVVAGDAETFAISFGTPEEVTPDELVPTPDPIEA